MSEWGNPYTLERDTGVPLSQLVPRSIRTRSQGKKKRRKNREPKIHAGTLAPGPNGEKTIRHYRTPGQARFAEQASWRAYRLKHQIVKDVGDFEERYVKCNRSERHFIRWAKERCCQIQRGGWPDFLVQSPTGQLAAVEVKRGGQELSPSQIRCAKLLEELGVTTYAWRRKTGLIKWNEIPARPDEPGCPSGQGSPQNGRSETEQTPNRCDPATGSPNPQLVKSPGAQASN